MHFSPVTVLFCIVIAYQIVLCYAPKPVNEPRVCKTSAECRKQECCVEPDLRRGKRQLGGVVRTCQPLGKIGDKCYANIIVHFEGPHAYYTPGCPCKNGKHCEVIGNEIPQGPVGVCKAGKAPASGDT